MSIGVSKYGGSSLKNAEMFQRTAEISLARMQADSLDQLVEVVSAVGKVDETPEGNKLTDLLEHIYYNGDDGEVAWVVDRVEEIFTELDVSDKIYKEISKRTGRILIFKS